MRVAITTWGSRGDVQPYLALAKEFSRAGHEVKLGAPRVAEFAAMASDHAVPFVPLGPTLGDDAMLDAARRAFQIRDPLRQIRIILDELMLPALEQMYEECRELGQWADVIVSHCLQPAGRMAAERLGRPFVTGTLVPSQLRSRHQPPRGLPNLGRWSNQLLWGLAIAGMNAGWAGGINATRRRVGLPPLRDLAGDGFYGPELNLVAVSPRIFPTPPDWLPRHQLTGYWFLDRPEWIPPAEVAAFVSQEPAPIAVGFGSMAWAGSEELTRIVVRAAERSGVRAMIEPGWAELGSGALPSGILRADGVPHSWLFPRVAAVVHHGGAGTTAAVLRAGVPSVFVPHIFDQEMWADLAFQRGVAPRAIARGQLSVDALAQAIDTAVHDPRLRERATRLGVAIRGEDGVGNAVRLVETYVRAPGAIAPNHGRRGDRQMDGGRSMPGKREKRITVGGVELAVALGADRVERIKKRASYQYVVRPALGLLGSLGARRDGHQNGAVIAPSRPVPGPFPSTPEARAILDRIAGIEWYHSIDLGHGVTTPGFTDHRGQLALYDLPADLHGMRALDVATYDGFWAFELERRGAEVVAIDIGSWSQFDIPLYQLEAWRQTGAPDKPTGAGFKAAHEILGSRVERHVLSVYALSPAKLGTFDLVFLSDLLLHLRDPQRALENVRSVVGPSGLAVIADVYNPRLESIDDMTVSEFLGFGDYVWWRPSSATLKAMLGVAGFERVDEVARFTLAATAQDPIHKIVLKGYPGKGG
ncbi:MAG: nucleotide disphospho-sugar-binding domain-containing protein [Chloroflexota bacterium]